MNNEIQKFDFKGAALRTLTDEAGEPWFVLKDCMSILDLGNPTETVKMFDKDEFSTTEVIDSIGRRQQTYIISEPGLLPSCDEVSEAGGQGVPALGDA